MARIAVIDLGTNTFNILIVDRYAGENKILHQQKVAVKLGEGGINQGVIRDLPFQRGLAAMDAYSKVIAEYGADNTYAFATSAIRSSSNGKQFCEEVAKLTGIFINIIDGDKEADLIYKGVRKSGVLGSKPSLILDIGGGSCEFIIGNETEFFWRHSFDLGVSRLRDKYKQSNPILSSEIEIFEQVFDKELTILFEALKQFPSHELVGSSGSFDTFAEMIWCRQFENIDYLEAPFYEFRIIDFEQNHTILINSTAEQRLTIKGLIAMRVDMIVIASVMVNFLIKKLDITSLKLSAYSLKEGVMAEL